MPKKRKKKTTYSSKTLELVAADRGYSRQALVKKLSLYLNRSATVINAKIGSGNWTLDDIMIVGTLLEMTPKEFYETFLNGLFQENNIGIFKCSYEGVADRKPDVLKKR